MAAAYVWLVKSAGKGAAAANGINRISLRPEKSIRAACSSGLCVAQIRSCRRWGPTGGLFGLVCALGGSRTRRVRWPLDCIKGAICCIGQANRGRSQRVRACTPQTLFQSPSCAPYNMQQQQREMRPRAPHRAELKFVRRKRRSWLRGVFPSHTRVFLCGKWMRAGINCFLIYMD